MATVNCLVAKKYKLPEWVLISAILALFMVYMY